MKIKYIKLLSILIAMIAANAVLAHIDPNRTVNKPSANNATTATSRMDCTVSGSQTDLQVNNVRARLQTGGDIWWDRTQGRYIVPKVAAGEPEVSSIFAGGVWIGGRDVSGNLKLAASTFASANSVDFWPGPLNPNPDTDAGEVIIDATVCEDWDRFFKVDGEAVRQAIALYDFDPAAFDCDEVSDDVRYYPGKGNPYWLEEFDFELPNTGQGLGSFFDNDEDGIYDPCNGDFPIIDIRRCEPVDDNGNADRNKARELVPDEMIFWIYNDAGNIHRESQGDAINMEVQAQAFAYATNDEINDMSFIRYKLINRAESDIQDCYFAMWVDPDLGCYNDDYIGCDVDRSLAYVYNEDAVDGFNGPTCPGGVNTYGTRVPILGVDYFRGPRAPKLIGAIDSSQVDSTGMTIFDTAFVTPPPNFVGSIDTFIEEGMTSFVYTNNAGVGTPDPITTDPQIADEYYELLLGNWRTGDAITFGSDGLNPGSTDTVRYVFPDDPNNGAADAWSMCTEDLPFGDRRTIQATGPLLLRPNEINELIVGVVWVPNIAYPCPDISRLQFADDLAQALFDNCFDITDGPDAPDASFVELDEELIMILTNDPSIFNTNNPNEMYQEEDLLAPSGVEDPFYRFEGYLIYQLENPSVSPQEFDDINQARLVRQVDVKNGVSILYNYTPEIDPITGVTVFNREDLVEQASDNGIRHTFSIKADAFSDGDSRLVNHQPYYFSVVAYAYNNFEDFKVDDGVGQRTQYLEGRKNIETYTVVPRPIVYQNQRAEYGDGPTVIRLDGQGNGGNFINVAPEMYDAMLDQDNFNGEITYTPGNGPIKVEIYNPLEVKDAVFTLEIVGEFDDDDDLCVLSPGARWTLTNDATGEVISSDRDIDVVNEQLIVEYGFSVTVNQVAEPGAIEDGVFTTENNGAIGASIEYADEGADEWIFGLGDNASITNDQGVNILGTSLDYITEASTEAYDPDQELVNMNNQFMNPFIMADYRATDPLPLPAYLSPAWLENSFHDRLLSNGNISMDDLNNVDIIFTSDKSKWSRCVVVERFSELNELEGFNSVGNANNFELRESPSIDKDGNEDGDGTGMGWFPGYAVDVETGKRLNIFFGENSVYNESVGTADEPFPSNGGDMIFNPSNELFTDLPMAQTGGFYSRFVFGGQHTVYVTRQEYDDCAAIREDLNRSLFVQRYAAFSQITWAGSMMLANGVDLLPIADGLIPNDVVIKLRVNSPYSPERIADFSDDQTEECITVGGNPKYRLVFDGVEPENLEMEEHEGALANVNVVPNPYYAFSSYETSQFTNTIKVTNLPDKAEITIFTIDGKFIRQINRDETPMVKEANRGTTVSQTLPNVEWDLKNFAGIPVASGVYIFHINAPDLGEQRSIKWFGINRQFDPTGL